MAHFLKKMYNNSNLQRGHLIDPPSTPDFLSELGLNLALGLAWLLPVAVIRLHCGDLHAVGWGEGTVKAIRVGVGFLTNILQLEPWSSWLWEETRRSWV